MNANLLTVRNVEGFKQNVAVCMNNGKVDDPQQIRSNLMAWVNKVEDLDQETWEVGNVIEKSIVVNGNASDGSYLNKCDVTVVGVNTADTKPEKVVVELSGCTLGTFVSKYNTEIGNIYGSAMIKNIVPVAVAFIMTN